MTQAAIQEELRDFAVELLEQCGGLVEWSSPDQDGTAVVPSRLVPLLHAPGEEFSLSCRPQPRALCVSLATDFLEVSGAVLEAAVPRFGSFHLSDRYLKGGDLQQAVDRAFTWLNARVRVRGSQPAPIEYHTWWFHAALRSDDCWETRLAVTLNSDSLGPVELPDPLGLPDVEPCSAADVPASATYLAASRHAQQRLRDAASGFISRMDARLERDRRRLRDYYNALLKETQPSRKRAAEPLDPEAVAARRQAVQLELRRKLAELDERYAMEAIARPIVLIRTSATVLVVELLVERKRARRKHVLYWNPLVKQFEPLPCGKCGTGAFAIAFTNDDVAPQCAKCAAASSSAAKS